jgi:excisionase family DNA binding protein
MSEYLTLEEAAERMGVEYKTLYRLVRSGDLPAGKIGRLYRIRAEDLDAYFEKQKTLLVKQARGLMALENVKCGACGKAIVSELSIGGRCGRCDGAICQACWAIRKARHCGAHAQPAEKPTTPKPTSASLLLPPTTGRAVEDPARVIERLRGQGKAVVTPSEAALMEEQFLRGFGQRLEQIEHLGDPLSGHPIMLREARVKHTLDAGRSGELSTRISRFELRSGGWGRPKACLTLEAIFAWRADAAGLLGYDADAIDAPQLAAMLSEIAQRAKAAGCFHTVLIASPTGWTAAAVAVLTRPRGPLAFSDKRVAAALVDLDDGRVVLNDDDARLGTLLPLLDPDRAAEVAPRCRGRIAQAIAGRHTLSLAEAVKVCGEGVAWVRLAFEQLRDAGGYGLKDLKDGPTLYRESA